MSTTVTRSTRVCHVNNCSVWLTNCSETKSHLLVQQSFLSSIFRNAFSTFSKTRLKLSETNLMSFHLAHLFALNFLSMADPSFISTLNRGLCQMHHTQLTFKNMNHSSNPDPCMLSCPLSVRLLQLFTFRLPSVVTRQTLKSSECGSKACV